MSNPNRILSLDALRGFAILTMVLSGVIPYGVLPSWMYHAQIPPPTHTFSPDVPGLTWVDLVFPLFLFALGAAIPLALNRKIDKKESYLKIVFQIAERTFLLVFFAIFLKHIRPHSLNSVPSNYEWLIGFVGFILMFLNFARFPRRIPKPYDLILKITGWIGSIVLLSILTYPDNSGFSLYRSDIIILVLANVYFFGSLIWLCTQNNWLIRLGILAIYLSLRLAHSDEGIAQWIWENIQIPWLFKIDFLKYLFIVIPGTIVGDLILNWSKSDVISNDLSQNSIRNSYLIAVYSISFVPITLIGFQNRWVWQTGLVLILMLIIGFWLFKQSKHKNNQILFRLFNWALFWLLIGIILEPFEGGIKKDPSTLSYYFTTTGLSIFILITFLIVIDFLKKQSFVGLLIKNGQNPMIAYVGIANFIWPVFSFLTLDSWIESFTTLPWLGFLRGLFYTLLLAFIVSFITRLKIFWKT